MQSQNDKIARKFENLITIFVLLFLLFFGSVWTLVTVMLFFGNLTKGNEIDFGLVLLLVVGSIGPTIVISSLRGIYYNIKQIIRPDSSVEHKSQVAVVNVLFNLWIVMGIVFTIWGVYLFYEDVFLKEWKPLTAIIEISEFQIQQTSLKPVVKYSYIFDGVEYFGALQPPGRIGEDQKFLDRHTAGSSIQIKINAKNPSENKLDLGIIAEYMRGLAGIAGGLLFVFIGIVLKLAIKRDKTQTKSKDRSTRWGSLFGIIIIVGYGFVSPVIGTYLLVRDNVLTQWETLTGKIVIPDTNFVYSYVYNGKEYHGIFLGWHSGDEETNKKFIARHPAGSQVSIKVNKADPYHSKVVQDPISENLLSLAFIFPAFIIIPIFLKRKSIIKITK